jgi:hypothetical protein
MPKSAKLAEFLQGHFIRFWDRGQAILRVGVWAYRRHQQSGETHASDETNGSALISPMGPISPIGQRSPDRRSP